MNSTKKQARLAGLLYLLASIIGPFCFIYVPGKLIVPGDATTTANHIRASETLLRLGIASELTSLWFWLYIAYSRRLTGNMRWRWRFCSCSPIPISLLMRSTVSASLEVLDQTRESREIRREDGSKSGRNSASDPGE